MRIYNDFSSIKEWVFVVLLLLASLPVILPYFHSGYFPTHDGEWAVVRLADMIRSLREGQFPVRWSGFLNHGYGYPLFNFSYPFPYYLGAAINFIFRIGLVDTIKIIFFLTVPVSTVGMYFLAKSLWRNTGAGVISALFYIYLPYRIVDLYVRGSIGESLSLALFPWLGYLALKVVWEKDWLWPLLLGVSYAALILTHNIMTVLFTPFLLVLIVSQLVFSRKITLAPIFYRLLISIFLALGLAAFFWYPALTEKNFIALSQTPIANRSAYFSQPLDLVIPRWGYGMADTAGGFGYQIGWPHLVILGLVAIVSLGRKNKDRPIALVVVLSLVAACFLLFRPSEVIWQNTPFLKEINYPWTLLAPIGFLVSLLGGYLASGRYIRLLALALSLAAITFVLPHSQPASFVNRNDSLYITNDATTTSSDELMPLWVKRYPSNLAERKVEILSGQGQIEQVVSNSYRIEFTGTFPQVSRLKLNSIYFPGWKVLADGKELNISYTNDQGVIEFELPAGRHRIQAVLEDTPVRRLANTSSLVSVIFLGILSVHYVKKKYF